MFLVLLMRRLLLLLLLLRWCLILVPNRETIRGCYLLMLALSMGEL